jgi:hypothetical protein
MDGTNQTKWFVSGEGLCSDPSHIMIFGLGDQEAQTVTVKYLSGETKTLEGPFVNETINVEG